MLPLTCSIAILTLGVIVQAPALENSGVQVGAMTYARQDHTATLLADGRVLIVGWTSNTAEIFDPATGSFATTGATVANHRQGLTATRLNNGKVLIAGGVNAQRVAELYDPATGLFTLTDSLRVVHAYHTATLLPDGRVLIAAGQDNAGPQTHAVAEIYDPAAETFVLTDSLNGHRSSHTATLLPDGNVLITGGIQTTTPGSGMTLLSCEVYDLSSGSFAMAPPMRSARVGHSATLLGTGSVLIGGGAWSSNRSEIYNPVLRTWTQTDTMTVIRRNNHTATLLTDGRVLLAGGFVNDVTPTVEVYDPVTNAFTTRDTMTTRRTDHASTRLMDGDVLITGGYNGSTALTSAQLFDGSVPTGVRSDDGSGGTRTHPVSATLDQNYPNPFNPNSYIGFQIPAPRTAAGPELSIVRLAVFDLLGREVAVLVNEKKDPGTYQVRFDGSSLASGVYIYRLEAGTFVQSKTLMLLK
jgi:hypothetical protein